MFSSFYEWPLSATVLAGLSYPVWRIARKGRAAFLNITFHTSESATPFHERFEPVGFPIRGLKLKFISAREFKSLLVRSSDLIAIDLREGDQWAPLQLQASVSTLRIANYELAQVLEHFPANSTVVFFGVTDLSALIIEASPIAKGSAPIYALNGQIGKDEME